MKNWFTSLNGAIALSAFAWVTEIWRAWLDMLFEYPNPSIVNATIDSGITLVITLIYTAIFAGWAYAMHSAARGNRGALIATFVVNAFVWLAIPVGWIIAYCTGPCVANAGVLFNLANWLNLIFGLLAALPLALQLRQKTVTAGLPAYVITRKRETS